MSLLLAAGGSGSTYTLTVTPATVALTGQSVGLYVDRRIAVLPATVAIAGSTVALAYSGTVAPYRIAVVPATLAITGQSVEMIKRSPATEVPGPGSAIGTIGTIGNVSDSGIVSGNWRRRRRNRNKLIALMMAA